MAQRLTILQLLLVSQLSGLAIQTLYPKIDIILL